MAPPCDADIEEAIQLLEPRSRSTTEIAELTEFLTCELAVRPADMAFRERLRANLWWAFAERLLGRTDDRTPTA